MSTQPCISLRSLNRVPASVGWVKSGNVTAAVWRVTLCDPMWHVSFGSREVCCKLLYPVIYFTLYHYQVWYRHLKLFFLLECKYANTQTYKITYATDDRTALRLWQTKSTSLYLFTRHFYYTVYLHICLSRMPCFIFLTYSFCASLQIDNQWRNKAAVGPRASIPKGPPLPQKNF